MSESGSGPTPGRSLHGQHPRDPDVDLQVQSNRQELLDHRVGVLGAIAVGGALGAEARYGLGVVVVHAPGGWPWSTLIVNVSGCLLIGVLMAIITELPRPHRLVRPFLGVGVLGGYTTFSTYSVEILTMLQARHAGAAIAYLVATPLLALAAVAVGTAAARPLRSATWGRDRKEQP
jgi:CrcB protein